MAEGEPVKKKIKVALPDVFENFLSDSYAKRRLKFGLDIVKCGAQHCIFRSCKIKRTNLEDACSFTKAYFRESDEMPDVDQMFTFGQLFRKGVDKLSAFIDSEPNNPQIPENEEIQAAFKRLFLYFKNMENEYKALEEISKTSKEWPWTLVLAQHIFSKLAPSSSYLYDIGGAYDTSEECPCVGHDKLCGQQGDTSFGWESGWHGRTDIIMADLPVINVCEIRREKGGDLPRVSSSLSVASSISSLSEKESLFAIEGEKNDVFTENELCQIFAETITFSFLKNKENPDVTLIPSIAVGKKTFTVTMYDSKEDVFLQGGDVSLFDMDATCITSEAIVAIWLTLNYQLFGTGVLDSMDRSGLHNQIDVKSLQTAVKAPCKKNDPGWIGIRSWQQTLISACKK